MNPFVKFVIALLVFTFGGSAFAATYVWQGGGGNSNWSTGANWSGGAPLSATNTQLQFGASLLTATDPSPYIYSSPVADAPLTVNSISLSLSGVPTIYSLSGSAITLGGTSPTIQFDQGYRIRRHRKPREKTVHRQWVMTGACKPR